MEGFILFAGRQAIWPVTTRMARKAAGRTFKTSSVVRTAYSFYSIANLIVC